MNRMKISDGRMKYERKMGRITKRSIPHVQKSQSHQLSFHAGGQMVQRKRTAIISTLWRYFNLILSFRCRMRAGGFISLLPPARLHRAFSNFWPPYWKPVVFISRGRQGVCYSPLLDFCKIFLQNIVIYLTKLQKAGIERYKPLISKGISPRPMPDKRVQKVGCFCVQKATKNV